MMMQQTLRRLASILLLTTLCGCQWASWLRREPVAAVDPALPMTLSRDELVDYVNSQIAGLESWRCTRTKMVVRMPGVPQQKLSGSIACQSPQHFRLTANNVIAHADLGSNAEQCWVYVQPGEPAVMTWRHEDSALLQQIPTGVPYIDPNWLMLVVGVKPLHAEDYVLSSAPPRELWLNASERSPEGRMLRRVIKVDTVAGAIREHAVYDDQSNVLVRAQLSEHEPFEGRLIATKVNLDFPQMDSQISLTFDDIETNPHLPEALWSIPQGKGMEIVDLGSMLRQQLRQQGFPIPDTQQEPFYTPPGIRLEEPQFDQNSTSPNAGVSPPLMQSPVQPGSARPGHALAEPNWDAAELDDAGAGVTRAGHWQEDTARKASRGRSILRWW